MKQYLHALLVKQCRIDLIINHETIFANFVGETMSHRFNYIKIVVTYQSLQPFAHHHCEFTTAAVVQVGTFTNNQPHLASSHLLLPILYHGSMSQLAMCKLSWFNVSTVGCAIKHSLGHK